MLVRDFMSKPAVTCTPEQTLEAAARSMDLHNVGCLVVVADDGHLVGIVTDRDIALKATAWGQGVNATVADAMSKRVVIILEDADGFEAAQKMARWGVRRMPVVNPSGAIQGLIALDDVTGAMADEMVALRRTVSTQMAGGPGRVETDRSADVMKPHQTGTAVT
jgi:CBS domain-containing protein